MMQKISTKLFNYTSSLWFITLFVGQNIFAYYIIMLYAKSAVNGNLDKWNSASDHFYIKGDTLGNIIFGVHVAIAAIITILGPLQLIPQLRLYAPKFHRVSGRLYIYSAFIISLAGLYLIWIKGSMIGGLTNAVAISINSIIIMLSAYFTIKYAVTKKIVLHNKWAVHLFIAMSGVWFFRVYLMLWLAIWKAPVGFDSKSFTGPFLNVLSLMVYIFPQAIVALYFYAKNTENYKLKFSFTLFLFVLTLGTVVGIIAATMGMWLPRI
jgi:hypothetical protein